MNIFQFLLRHNNYITQWWLDKCFNYSTINSNTESKFHIDVEIKYGKYKKHLMWETFRNAKARWQNGTIIMLQEENKKHENSENSKMWQHCSMTTKWQD